MPFFALVRKSDISQLERKREKIRDGEYVDEAERRGKISVFGCDRTEIVDESYEVTRVLAERVISRSFRTLLSSCKLISVYICRVLKYSLTTGVMPSDTIIFNWLVSLHLFVASAGDKASYSCNCDNTRIEFHYSTVRPSIKAKMPLDIIRALINKLIRIL